MNLRSKKRIAAILLKCSPKRVKFDEERLSEIKEAITKEDIRSLINDSAITRKPVRGVSRARANETLRQKRKGRQKGHGSRKGHFGARLDEKRAWINRVRLQRDFVKELKAKNIIANDIYHNLYNKVKGGFFRSKRHIKIYLEERHLARKE